MAAMGHVVRSRPFRRDGRHSAPLFPGRRRHEVRTVGSTIQAPKARFGLMASEGRLGSRRTQCAQEPVCKARRPEFQVVIPDAFDRSASVLPAPEFGTEGSRADVPHVVGDVDRHSRGHDLVDTVEHVAGQVDPVGGKVGVQVLHGARADDRGGDRRVAGGERDRHLDERQPGLVGERAEGVGGVELCGVGGLVAS